MAWFLPFMHVLNRTPLIYLCTLVTLKLTLYTVDLLAFHLPLLLETSFRVSHTQESGMESNPALLFTLNLPFIESPAVF